jgi:CPA2 family monovalent cation:H+ antiporter-2
MALSGKAVAGALLAVRPIRHRVLHTLGLSTDPGDPRGAGSALLPASSPRRNTPPEWAAPSWSRPPGSAACWCGPRRQSEFSIIIAGLALGVTGGEDLAALAAAYVLIMAVAGPLLAKIVDVRRPRLSVT